MVLGNRKIIVASTLMALPVALLMASLTTGTSPDGLPQAAFAHNPADGGVTQAVGTDINGVENAGGSPLHAGGMSSRSDFWRRSQNAGLVLPTANPSPTRAPNTTSAQPSVSGGLLGNLFSGNGRPQPTPASAKPASQARQRQARQRQARQQRTTTRRLERHSIPRTTHRCPQSTHRTHPRSILATHHADHSGSGNSHDQGNPRIGAVAKRASSCRNQPPKLA